MTRYSTWLRRTMLNGGYGIGAGTGIGGPVSGQGKRHSPGRRPATGQIRRPSATFGQRCRFRVLPRGQAPQIDPPWDPVQPGEGVRFGRPGATLPDPMARTARGGRQDLPSPATTERRIACPCHGVDADVIMAARTISPGFSSHHDSWFACIGSGPQALDLVIAQRNGGVLGFHVEIE